MNTILTKLKGLVFVIAGLAWLVAVFSKSWPSGSLNANGAFLFLLASFSGFGVITQGVSWLENNTNE